MLKCVAEVNPLHTLASGASFRFHDWPNAQVPNWRAGVYTVWSHSEFLYVGMAGRGLADGAHLLPEASSSSRNRGLRDRLNAHASGRRSGDQFCVYVCDRLVIPTLTADDVAGVGTGTVSLDDRTRLFIRNRLTYRFVVTATSREAHELESAIRSAGLDGVSPLLNPKRGTNL